MPRLNLCYIIKNYNDMGMNYGELYAYTKSKETMKHFMGLKKDDAFYIKEKKMTKSEYRDLRDRYPNRKIIYMEDKDKKSNQILIPITQMEENLIHTLISHEWFEVLPKYMDIPIDIFIHKEDLINYGYNYFHELYTHGYSSMGYKHFFYSAYNMKLPLLSKIISNTIMSNNDEEE